jgi:tripartite motif-containing protein 71
MTSELSIEQIQQRLTCPVCLERYKQPKLLPCQHTFCLTPCLVNLVDLTTRRIRCPECRAVHMLPIQGVEAFPNNITILRFLDLNLSSPNRTVLSPDKCHQCNNKRDGLSKCIDCEKYFCAECRSIHLAQLKNEIKQGILSLRRILPMLSQKVGRYIVFIQ